MKQLEERIRQENSEMARNILKVDSFLNHQIDPDLMQEIGQELAERLRATEPTKILTIETSGIAPALATAGALHIPLVVARKRRVAGMPHELLQESTLSPTLNQIVQFFVSPEFLKAHDRVVIIDAFMTTGQTLLALARLVQSAHAQVVGIGTVIEKQSESGRQKLELLGVPVESVVKIREMTDGVILFADDK